MDPLESQSRECRRCRAALGEQARFCEACGAPVTPAAELSCAACGAGMAPAAQFCARCGAPTAGRQRLAPRAGWERLRIRARAVDWTRVSLVALPPLALLLAGLVGFALGRQNKGPASPPDQTASATRGWRADRPAEQTAVPGSPEESEGPEAALTAQPQIRSAAMQEEQGAPTRFRDFQITASSWELAHPPIHAIDGDPYTFWHAWKTEQFPNGEWLTLTFPTERVITRIGLLPGRMGAGARAEGRVRSLLVKAGDATPQKLLFEDRPAVQLRDLDQALSTRKLILRIVSVDPGQETGHIVVPEVQVWGYPASNLAAGETRG